MFRSRQGLTLLEVVVALAIVAILSLYLVGTSVQLRMSLNERAAREHLRQVALAQTSFHTRGFVDRDADGVGEYGFFSQLADHDTGLLPAWFGRVVDGVVERGGYRFALWLPDGGGSGVLEASSPLEQELPSVDAAEQSWRCYAWPSDAGVTGQRAFFVDESAIIHQNANWSSRP